MIRKDNGAPARNAAAASIGCQNGSTARRRDSRLNEFLRAQKDLLLDARDELSDREYGVWVEIVTDVIGLEATRLVVGEALRATRRAANSEAA